MSEKKTILRIILALGLQLCAQLNLGNLKELKRNYKPKMRSELVV